jgi:hypothetical protein
LSYCFVEPPKEGGAIASSNHQKETCPRARAKAVRQGGRAIALPNHQTTKRQRRGGYLPSGMSGATVKKIALMHATETCCTRAGVISVLNTLCGDGPGSVCEDGGATLVVERYRRTSGVVALWLGGWAEAATYPAALRDPSEDPNLSRKVALLCVRQPVELLTPGSKRCHLARLLGSVN